MSAASQRVWVKVPWWKHRDTPGPAQIFQALVAAAGRGCDVRVLLRPEASNSATLAALNKARVAVQALRYLHEKELLADAELLVHSANFTRPELHRNQNAGYRITQSQDIQAAEAAFELFWQAAAGTVAAGKEQWLPAFKLLPPELLPFFADTPRLNPMQARALPVVLTTGGHVVLGARTGAGKTLVGAAAALRAILLEGRKAVWLTPARSLAGELNDKFQAWQAHGVRVVKLTGEEQTATPELRRAQLWVATTEKFESICRKTSVRALIDDVGCIVVDEIHLVGDPTRGPTLEGLLARLRLVAQQTRIVGLSGTVSNLELLCDWLQAEKLESYFEPVPVLKQLVGYDPGTTRQATNQVKDELVQTLVGEARSANEPTLVFCGSKPAVMRTAAKLANLEPGEDWAGLAAACRQRGVGVLFRGAPDGAAAEQAFRSGQLGVLVATSAVATGVNLPAKVVVIRDEQLGLDPLQTDVALQMLGRAGRYGQAELGRGYLLVPFADYGDWRQRLREGHVVHSRILDRVANAILAEILRGAITTTGEAREWFAGTLAHAEGQAGDEPIEPALDLLLDNGFVNQQPDRLVVTPLGRLTSQFLIDPEVASEVLTSLRDLKPPTHPDDAESLLLATLAGGVPDFCDAYLRPQAVGTVRAALADSPYAHQLGRASDGTCKSLLAAHLALTQPNRLAGRGDLAGVPAGELRDLADQLGRHLGWLAALQLTSTLDWQIPIAADLAQRIKHRRAQPPRGAGRLLRLLEATSTSKVADRYTPFAFAKLQAAGIHAPDQLNPNQLESSLRRLLQDWPGFVTHRLTLTIDHVEAKDGRLQLRLQGPASNLSLRLRAHAGQLPQQAQLDGWSGQLLTIPAPDGAEHGQVAIDLLASNRHDWCYMDGVFRFDPARLYDAIDEEARRLIRQLPQQLLLSHSRTGWARLGSAAQRRRREAQAVLNSDLAALAPLAGHLAGHGLLEQRITNLTGALDRLLTLRPSVAGDHSSPRHPTAVLVSGVATRIERSLTLAVLLRALGCEVGLLTSDENPDSLIPMIQTNHQWRAVEQPHQPGSLTPLFPKRAGDSDTLTVLRQPAAARQPHTNWGLLSAYRSSNAAEEVASDGQ
jgi:superfamily II DNA/RNA helicase